MSMRKSANLSATALTAASAAMSLMGVSRTRMNRRPDSPLR
jgi:hypothetical protein